MEKAVVILSVLLHHLDMGKSRRRVAPKDHDGVFKRTP